MRQIFYILTILILLLVSCNESKKEIEKTDFTSKNKFNLNIEKILNIEEILKKSSEACLDLKSIEYEITQKALKGKYGFPEIKATIVHLRDNNIEDVGFDKAMIKAKGTIEEKGIIDSFSFSFNGEQFMYKRGKEGKQKRVSKPIRKTTMGYLQQFLFMLRVFPFTEDTPYKTRWGEYTLEKEEEINGELCYKIKSSSTMEFPNGKSYVSSDTWWINKQDYLPRAYSDGVLRKDISILKLNRKISKDFFSIVNDNTFTEEVSYQQAQQEIDSVYLLKINTVAPKWVFVSQKGESFSTENLKSKVVFIDFWGTWCRPCTKAMPDIENLYQHYKNNKDVAIIGISAEEREDLDAEDYFKRENYNYIHIPNGDSIAKLFKVKLFPTIYILDKNGKIVYAGAGYNPKDDFEKWKEAIDKYLLNDNNR